MIFGPVAYLPYCLSGAMSARNGWCLPVLAAPMTVPACSRPPSVLEAVPAAATDTQELPNQWRLPRTEIIIKRVNDDASPGASSFFLIVTLFTYQMCQENRYEIGQN
jgi:hypothetical protein